MTRVLLLTPFAPHRAHDHAASDTLVRLVPRLAAQTELFVYSPQAAVPAQTTIAVEADGSTGEYTLLPVAERAVARPTPTDRFGVRPAWLRQAWSSGAADEAAAAIERVRPDVVHVEYLQGAEALAHSRRTVLGLHDITESVMAESYRVATGPARVYRRAELIRTRRFERTAIRRAGAVLTLSATDQTVARTLNPRVVLARPGVELPEKPWTAPVADTRPRLVFVGALWRRANELVARYLAEQVLPLVWQAHPQVELRLVGAKPGPALRALAAADQRIVVTGAVPDLQDEMRAAHAVLVPSIVGGGVLMKVLHAMALGAPVITSPGPAASVGADESMLYIGADPTGLAAAVDAALTDPAQAATRGEHARAHIGATFRWADTVRSYLDAYAIAVTR
ncbi:glycosyltransferase [Solwaraspora sp. WMMB335]|uniref:glycosyltransferase n=1 Tax=Solwaraspora sp. WMMB335 TaxID=3404118 RepID=UPI003B962DEC